MKKEILDADYKLCFAFSTWRSITFTLNSVPNEQRIVLELNDGKQFFLDDEPKKENKQVEKRRTLDYTNLARNSVPVVKKMLQTHSIVIPRGETDLGGATGILNK